MSETDNRQKNIQQHYNNSINAVLKDLMKIIEPGKQNVWGGMSHSQLVNYVIEKLGIEYRELSGIDFHK